MERGGTLYSPCTLQGNWLEDRAQQTCGSNDGLRSTGFAYKEMMENMVVYKGPVQEVSMPATEFGKVTTQETSRSLFACTRYRHPRQIPTQRVMPELGIPSSARFLTTSMLLANGERLVYTKDPRKAMVDATNMKETQSLRKTSLPEHGFGAIVPRFSGDVDLGKRYWDTTSRSFFVSWWRNALLANYLTFPIPLLPSPNTVTLSLERQDDDEKTFAS